MSYGLVCQDDAKISLQSIECLADITEDIGIFTLTQSYINMTDDILYSRYIFPINYNINIIDFSVLINNKQIELCAPKNTFGGFEAEIGLINVNDIVKVKIKYSSLIERENERTRIIIPTVVAPRFVTFNEQIALDETTCIEQYKVSLDLKYRNLGITNVVSKTHDIIYELEKNYVKVMLKSENYTDRDIVIDIYTICLNTPKLLYHNNIICCSFSPEIDIYEKHGREYLFMLDVSYSMTGSKLEQLKTTLLICLRALQKGDTFKIVAFEATINEFADEYLPINDDTLKVVSKWIQSLTPNGETEMFRPIINAFKGAKNRIAIIFTDGQISGSNDILTYVSRHEGVIFYTFGIDNFENKDFLSKLAEITGGRAKFISTSERIDDTIIKNFNTIVAPTITNAVIDFDEPVIDFFPKCIKRIHFGENIKIMANIGNNMPKQINVKGQLEDLDIVLNIKFSEIIDGGIGIKYLYDNNNHIKSIENTEELPCNFYDVNRKNIMRELCMRTKAEQYFIDVAKTQRANGSFIPKNSRSRENIALYSAQVLMEFCYDCSNVDMYIWLLRKTAGFLLDHIENSNYGKIPIIIIKALMIWHEILGGTDEISQKVAVLEFLNRGKC